MDGLFAGLVHQQVQQVIAMAKLKNSNSVSGRDKFILSKLNVNNITLN